MILEMGVHVLHPHPSRCLCILFFPETRGKDHGDTGHSGSWIGPWASENSKSSMRLCENLPWLGTYGLSLQVLSDRSEVRSKLANLSNFILKIGIISILVEMFCDII